jgi:CHAD domain-containing protein
MLARRRVVVDGCSGRHGPGNVHRMSYKLGPQEPFGPGLRRVLLEGIEDAVHQLEGARDSNWEEAVHEARKSIKKSRAALRLARPSIGPLYGQANSALRDVGRSLSEVRDGRVIVNTLDGLSEAFPERAGDQSFARVRRTLVERRDRATRQAMAEHLPEQAAQRTRRVAALVARGPWEEAGWDFIDGGLRRAYRRGRSALAAAVDDPRGETVHAWRKRVKDRWYHMRLLKAGWPPVLKKDAKEAHSLSDLLGDEHDLVVLQETLEADAGDGWDRADARFLSSLAGRRRAELLAAAVPLGRRLYAEKPSPFTSRIRRYWRFARAEATGQGGEGLHTAVGA